MKKTYLSLPRQVNFEHFSKGIPLLSLQNIKAYKVSFKNHSL